MTSVKAESTVPQRPAPRKGADPHRHLAELLGKLFVRTRERLYATDWAGLRVSHFRLLSNVPADGISITDLAREVGMTKQGCGQFVRFLTGSGHAEIRLDPDDRRTKRVYRTAAGDRLIAAVEVRIAEIERDYAALVGPRRYAQFRRTLEDLVDL
jgi:DNA-binding MarR family transcriptional regulator